MRETSKKWIIPHYLESTASVRGDAIAVIDEDRRVTYSELRAQVFELAAQLLQRRVGRGDRLTPLSNRPSSTGFSQTVHHRP
jgi:non-ribosomal peptide synthetase component E (peptide arylation enzyme)